MKHVYSWPTSRGMKSALQSCFSEPIRRKLHIAIFLTLLKQIPREVYALL